MKPLLTTLILSFLILPLFTFAQGSLPSKYSPPVTDGVITGEKNGLVPCEGSFCGTCDVIVLANTGIKWLLTLTFLFFAVLAVRAGVKLITSQGNAGALSDAKQSFTNAFIGLIIMLVAWLIVDTMLRQLLDGGTGNVNGYGPWSKVQCTSQEEPVSPKDQKGGYFGGDPQYIAENPDSIVNGPPVSTGNPQSCSGGTCVSLSPVPCKTGCTISVSIADKIKAMHASAAVSGARVTEAMPALSQNHYCSCHYKGTCIDYSKTGGMSAKEINSVISAATKNNLRPVYEVKTQGELNTLANAGVPKNYLLVVPHASAPHFSIYGGQCMQP